MICCWFVFASFARVACRVSKLETNSSAMSRGSIFKARRRAGAAMRVVASLTLWAHSHGVGTVFVHIVRFYATLHNESF